jgi:hypothetical protein
MGRKGTARPKSIAQPSLDEEICLEDFSQGSGIGSSLDKDSDALLLYEQRHVRRCRCNVMPHKRVPLFGSQLFIRDE